jgi:hypothetical protein
MCVPRQDSKTCSPTRLLDQLKTKKKKEEKMKASGVYSKGLKAEDLADCGVMVLTINDCKLAQFEGQQDKIELNFGETDKTLILNVTNKDVLCEALGDETDNWPGAKIQLVRTKLDRPFKGQTHTLRIAKVKKPPVVAGGKIVPPPPPATDDFGPESPDIGPDNPF